MKFVNLTPHAIIIEGGPTIPPSGTVARAETMEREVEPIGGIPTIVREFGSVEGIPGPMEDVTFVVSSLVLERCGGRSDVVAPDTGPTAIRSNGQLVAVTRLVRARES